MGNITFLLGGARSGKSSHAVELAKDCQGSVVYLATGISCDEEMERRFEKHRNDRPKAWKTIEEPLCVGNVLKGLSESADLVLLDCLGFLVTNLMLHYQNQGKDDSQVEDEVMNHVMDIASTVRDAELDIAIVSNEVGMGVVPASALGRLFRDILGRANQMIAACADEVFFFVAGLPMKLK